MGYEKKTYLPGIVDGYQKPWYSLDGHHVRYTGRFCEKGHYRVFLEFDPIRRLIDEVTDPDLKDRMVTLVEEMEDAYYAKLDEHTRSIPSYMYD